MRGDFFKRVLVPAMIPLGAFVFIGALVFGFSRILLAVPKDGSVVVGVLIAGCILFAAGAVAKGGKIKLQQRAALVAFAMLVLVGGVATGLSIGTRPIKGHAEVEAKITAQNIKFDKNELDLPSEAPFIIEFDNKDSVPHNVAIYDKPPTTPDVRTFFKPALTPGPKVTEFTVTTSIPTGVWYFQCDAHTTMNGVARVGGAKGAGPGGASPSPSPSAPAPPPPPASGAPTAAETIVAKPGAFAFDKNELSFAANKQAALELDNQDPGIPHNWSLYRDAGYTELIFKGDPPVTGPAKQTYRFTAPGPGTYYFQCDFHQVPAMRGTVTIR